MCVRANYVFTTQALHNAGLVHRDVKPMNIIFAEDEKTFKLIDLGACADLRSGTNYIPDESILDPTYCPPEQVLLTLYAVAAACCSTPCQLLPSICVSNANTSLSRFAQVRLATDVLSCMIPIMQQSASFCVAKMNHRLSMNSNSTDRLRLT